MNSRIPDLSHNFGCQLPDLLRRPAQSLLKQPHTDNIQPIGQILPFKKPNGLEPLVLRPGIRRHLEYHILDILKPGSSKPLPKVLGIFERRAEGIRRFADQPIPFPEGAVGRQARVIAAQPAIEAFELHPPAGLDVVVALSDEGGKVADGENEIAREDEVEVVFAEGPGCFDVVDFEVAVGRDPGCFCV